MDGTVVVKVERRGSPVGWNGAVRLGLWLCLFILLGRPAVSPAETPAPSVHWGALAYPDQQRTLSTGFTMNRFTQFNVKGEAYPSTIDETIGLNFATLSWTERIGKWGTNLTVGAGPTSDQPSRFLQNDFAHRKILHQEPIPVGQTRETTDAMVGGSVTYWGEWLNVPDVGFVGLGIDSGTLYHEAYARIGLRRAPVPFVPFMRVSAMGRYGQLAPGSGFQQVAGQSYLGQVSLSIGDYRSGSPPRWELEVGASIDSGLFVDRRGNSIEQTYGTIALRGPGIHIELWDDVIADKDQGPTFGTTILIDLFHVIELFR
ncbi:hypothetical protein DNFV4_00786 [Nitrospira tepida]|uniref:Uncharacterized protein n=1 Tax=Nitrospira tepida TaxID=2973512 RepID=A0AA86MWK3_9BACT|nr:hypothetical protein DNFV4_00786 [Nitrospira tepida]